MLELIAHFGGPRTSIIRPGKKIGEGATGRIYQVNGQKGTVAKLYLARPVHQSVEAKIADMIQRRPNAVTINHNGKELVQIAWPIATLRNKLGALRGFLMPEIDMSASNALEDILQKSSRRAKGLPEFYGWRLLLAGNLASAVAELHSQGHYCIDMKPINLRFYPGTGYVALLDADGFSIQGASKRWPAAEYSDEYIAPEAQNIAPGLLGVEQDLFALAVIIFRLLNNGLHPYQGIDKVAGLPTSLQERIFKKLYAYGRSASTLVDPAPTSIHKYFEPATQALFDRAFVGTPALRPTAREWSTHLHSLVHNKVLMRCKDHPKEHAHFRLGCGLCALDVASKNRAIVSPPRFEQIQAANEERMRHNEKEQASSHQAEAAPRAEEQKTAQTKLHWERMINRRKITDRLSSGIAWLSLILLFDAICVIGSFAKGPHPGFAASVLVLLSLFTFPVGWYVWDAYRDLKQFDEADGAMNG